jgi:hypothetical protein
MTENKNMFDKFRQEHETVGQDHATGNKGLTVCKSKTCTNSLYKWTSSRDPRYCADCL